MSLSAEALRAVEPRRAAAWLRANGWELVSTRPGHTATWRLSAGAEGDYVVDLPLSTTFRDYTRRVAEIVDTLVVASGEPAAWVLAELHASTSPTPDFELDGVVVRLESDAPERGGVAVVTGQVDGEPRRVRVPMEAGDYALAIKAHQDGQLLRCEGELARSGRSFSLERVRHVVVVADED